MHWSPRSYDNIVTMSSDIVENTVKIVDSVGVNITNFVASVDSEIQHLSYFRTEGSGALAEIDNPTLLLGNRDVSSVPDCSDTFILVERDSTNDFVLVDKPENDILTENVCFNGEVEENMPMGNTDLNRPEINKPSNVTVSESCSENQVIAFNAKLIDEIVIEVDRPPNTVTSSYREDHLTRWPNSSDIDDESSSSSDEIYYSSDVSSTSSSSSTSSCSGNGKLISAGERPKIFHPKPKVQSYLPKTKGELTLDDLPPIQDLIISLPDEEPLEKIGIVYKLVDRQVLVQALKDTRPLDIDSVLFLEGRKPLGQVFDVLGPVPQPFYAVRFNCAEDIANKEIVQGLSVFCAPGRSEVTTYIFTEDLRRQRGSDASWKDNNEPPIQYIDYSDDEEERKAKQKRKAKSRDSSQKDVEIVHETKWPHISSSGSGRGQWFHGHNESSVPPRQVHFATQFRRPPPSQNPFMRFQTPPPPVFGRPPTFSRGPPAYRYGNNINAWPRLPENMGPVDGRSPFGFHFQGSTGPPPDFGHRPFFMPNGNQNRMPFHGPPPHPYSSFGPPQEPSYFSRPQERFGPPPPLQNPIFSPPDLRQNSSFNHSQDWCPPNQCTVPAGLFLPPPPPPPL